MRLSSDIVVKPWKTRNCMAAARKWVRLQLILKIINLKNKRCGRIWPEACARDQKSILLPAAVFKHVPNAFFLLTWTCTRGKQTKQNNYINRIWDLLFKVASLNPAFTSSSHDSSVITAYWHRGYLDTQCAISGVKAFFSQILGVWKNKQNNPAKVVCLIQTRRVALARG